MKNCSIRQCPGQCEERRITHVVKYHGEVIVLENVPAEVCSECGEVILPLSSLEATETMLKNPGKPIRTAPVYQVPDAASAYTSSVSGRKDDNNAISPGDWKR
ncbi:MAG: YgiT-type zinc finger protein [Syntrophobacteraceae bacterium]